MAETVPTMIFPEGLRERSTAQCSDSSKQPPTSENVGEEAQTKCQTDSVKTKKTIGRTPDGTGECRHKSVVGLVSDLF
jgi:hypothetical protein